MLTFCAVPFAQLVEVSQLLTKGGVASLVLVAAALLVYQTFQERFLGIWIAGGLFYFAYFETATLAGPLQASGALAGISQLSFVLSLSLLVLAVLVYTGSREYLWLLVTLSAACVLCVALRVGWYAHSSVLMVIFRALYGVIAALGSIRLALFSRGRREIGPWLMAVMLLLVHFDDSAGVRHAGLNVGTLIEVLLMLSMLLIVLHDSHAEKERLGVLNSLTAAIADARNSDSMMLVAIEKLKDLLGAKVAWIGLLEGGKMSLWQHIGLGDQFVAAPSEPPFSDGCFEQLVSDRATITAGLDALNGGMRTAAEERGLDHLVIVPLKGNSSMVGALILGVGRWCHCTREEKRFLVTISSHLGLALENLRLFNRISSSQRRLVSTFDSIDDLIFVHDSEQRVLRANRALANRLGRSLDEIIGRSCLELFPNSPRGCPYCARAGRGVGDGPDPCFGGFSTVSTSAYTEEPREENGTIHVVRDTTPMRAAEERFRVLFEEAQEGVFISTPDGQLLDCNNAFARMLGYRDGREVLSLDLARTFSASQHHEQYRHEMERNGFVRNYEFSTYRADGSMITLQENSFATRDSSGRTERYQGFLIDITEKKRAEEAVRLHNRELRALNAIAMASTQTFDLEELLSLSLQHVNELFAADEGSILLLEPGGGRLRRYSPAGQKSSTNGGPQECEVPASFWKELLVSRTEVITRSDLAGFPADVRQLLAGGGFEQLLGVTMWTGDREPLGLFTVSRKGSGGFGERDREVMVTIARQLAISVERVRLYNETIRAYEELRSTQEQLLQSGKMSALGCMVSGIAHELNNPLTAILGYAQLLETELVDERAKGFLSKLYRQTQRTQKIVQNLLSFSRQRKPHKGEINLPQVVEGTLALREFDLKLNNITVEKSFALVPRVVADFHQLEQVFLNIINNAVDSMLETSRGGKLTVSILQDSGYACVEFRDSGGGVIDASRIFDPFYTTKQPGKGTGLGLSICYGILKEHGGDIVASNHPEGGAVFQIRLPLGAVVEKKPNIDRPAPPKRASLGRLLLVEDEETILEFEREVLTSAGASVECFTSGESAIAQLQQGAYDLIILDDKLPGGWQTDHIYQWVRENRPGTEKRIIVTVSDQANQESLRFLDENGIPHLSKPFSVTELLTLVKLVASPHDTALGQLPGTGARLTESASPPN